ncbi:hypothetical protein PM082_021528 [Marasmius tenuissimus]|nr:hypothetical protein PM082_021528 [Marasmius tenuissimus]
MTAVSVRNIDYEFHPYARKPNILFTLPSMHVAQSPNCGGHYRRPFWIPTLDRTVSKTYYSPLFRYHSAHWCLRLETITIPERRKPDTVYANEVLTRKNLLIFWAGKDTGRKPIAEMSE